jgi:UDP-glucose 4-epimerase
LAQAGEDFKIRILDNFTGGTPEDLKEVSDFTFVTPGSGFNTTIVSLMKGDIRDSELVNFCANGVDCIVHLAANTGVGPSVDDPALDMESNVIGTFNMLEAARQNKIQKFIFASSGAPAGEVEPPIHEELPPHPVSPYGASKMAGEGYCSAYYRTFGIDTVCLRFGNVYGPRSKRKSSVVAKFVRQAIKDEKCTIFGDGTQTRDFIYIEDLIDAIVLTMERKVGGEIFQIATGKEHTVDEISRKIATLLKTRGIDMKIEYGASRLGDVKRNYSDTSKARRVLGWTPQTSVTKGLEKTIDYFLSVQKH